MEYFLEVIAVVFLVVLLIADIRAAVLYHRSKRGNDKQREQWRKQIKELGDA